MLIKLKGQVINLEDRNITLAVKDKNGVPTQLTKDHRVVTMQMLFKDDNCQRVAIVKAFDPQPQFVLPEVGKEWQLPDIRKYEVTDGTPTIDLQV